MRYYSKRKTEFKSSSDFRFLHGVYRVMDGWFLDPILGLIPGGIGDAITTVLTVPFIFTSVFRLRSVSLTLSLIYNTLLDYLLGVIPVVGNIFDFFHKSYKRSYKQIVGYVEGDQEVIGEVQSNALKTCILITVLCVLIRLVAMLLGAIFSPLTSCTNESYSSKDTQAVVSTYTTPATSSAVSTAASSTVQLDADDSVRSKAPSSSPVTSEAIFYCCNTANDLTFSYGYTPYSYENYVILTGDNGATGMYAGYNIVSYEKSSGKYNYIGFGSEVIVYPPLVISLCRKIVNEGECSADTEWEYAYEYYSGTTNRQMDSEWYTGTLGNTGITLELALDSKTPKGVGTYYYNRYGPDNRMIVYADVHEDGTLELNSYDTKYYDKPSEKMILRKTGSGYFGYWERPNRDHLDVSLKKK